MVINLGHDTLRVAHLPHADQFQCFHGGVLTGAFSQFSVIDTTTMVTTLSHLLQTWRGASLSPDVGCRVNEPGRGSFVHLRHCRL
jgi:hypothetical protein